MEEIQDQGEAQPRRIVPDEEIRDIIMKDIYTLDGETFTAYMNRTIFQHEILRVYLGSLRDTIQDYHMSQIPSMYSTPDGTMNVVDRGIQAIAATVQTMETELFDMRDSFKRVAMDPASQRTVSKAGSELTVEALRAELDKPRFITLHGILLALVACYIVWRCEALLAKVM
ncbi:hypothetical protein M406DRAFT_74312 [Cryphonectria parasitica EP155]|uniref:Uncharacterized protein n=1 Tax=Cryphonectria parasitica (strain ATCC 38755 / EP155) TaxID=660469 RepID=A0A9P4XV41_CRYP1|nr:uncharacterized protein M406DRAFT_74312 [Cryphonectria parasitica EP155]KAF3761351.1 hypothetical protein M406DRAFT_74312 [Cryphonectria parasitica EP155]